MHLTNVAVQKSSLDYDSESGGKYDLTKLRMYMNSRYGEDKTIQCFSDIHNIMIKSIQSVQKSIISDKHCFELYGYDILLDTNLKPWLLEVNASPSMTANTQHDNQLKVNLIDDVMTILDFEKILNGDEEQVGGFDLVYKGNQINLQPQFKYTTYIGCINNRDENLKKLALTISKKFELMNKVDENRDKEFNKDKNKENLKESKNEKKRKKIKMKEIKENNEEE